MNQSVKKKVVVDQFQYLGRWVDKQHFRAFVYDENGKEKLANSYDEFMNLTSSGVWFESKPVIPPKRKHKDDVTLPNGK